MKFLVGFLGFISAKTECNGSKYSPLGCFTDDPPFSVPGYRPARMPQSVSTVNPTFKLTNSRYTDNSIDWQNVATNRFVSGQTVTVLTHGWTAEWDDSSFLNDGRDAFKRKDRDHQTSTVMVRTRNKHSNVKRLVNSQKGCKLSRFGLVRWFESARLSPSSC